MDQPRVFISYSRQDLEYVRALVEGLRSAGADVWFDESGLMGGSAWADQIYRELERCQIFMVILSPAALRSAWVQREIDAAIYLRDRDPDRIFLPVVAPDMDPRLVPPLLRAFKPITGSPSQVLEGVVTALGLQPGEGATVPVSSPVRQRGDVADQRANTLVAQGDALREQQHYEEALALYEQATTIDPNAANAWAVKGAVLADLGRLTEAEVAFDEATRRDPNVAAFWQSKAEVLRRLRRDDDVVKACEHALALDPYHITLWTLKGHALWTLGRFTEAAVAYGKAMDLDPTSLGDMAKSVRAVIRRLGA